MPERDVLTAPVFFVGMPRSGTTICFEAFARHPDLAWPSNVSQAYPDRPALNVMRRLLDNRFVSAYGRKNQYGSLGWLNTYLPQPNEAYDFWDRYARPEFSRHWLGNAVAGPGERSRLRNAVAAIARWQGRRRFAAKLTGPPRIGYLNSVFPDARFVHVIRDGRAVVDSLLRVAFWREKGGLEGPFWQGALDDAALATWSAGGKDPAVLAGLQWCAVIRETRAEARSLGEGRYRELRYEDLVADPHGAVRDLFDFASLDDAARAHAQLDEGPTLVNMNHKFAENFDADARRTLTGVMASELTDLGYIKDADASGTAKADAL